MIVTRKSFSSTDVNEAENTSNRWELWPVLFAFQVSPCNQPHPWKWIREHEWKKGEEMWVIERRSERQRESNNKQGRLRERERRGAQQRHSRHQCSVHAQIMSGWHYSSGYWWDLSFNSSGLSRHASLLVRQMLHIGSTPHPAALFVTLAFFFLGSDQLNLLQAEC